MAVGDGGSAVWSGSSWLTTPMPIIAGAMIGDVSCASSNACIAVGQTLAGTEESAPLSEWWNGASWSQLPTPSPSGSYDTNLGGVSCTAANDCMAVGAYDSPDNVVASGEAFAEHWDGLDWAIDTAPNPAGAVWSGLVAVSCVTPSSCVSTGFFDDGVGSDAELLTEIWNGASWSNAMAVTPSGSSWTVGTQISCSASTACEMVGQSVQGETGATLAENWNGSTWSLQPMPGPAGSTNAYLTGVSCASPVTCVATGSASLTSGGSTAFAESYGGP